MDHKFYQSKKQQGGGGGGGIPNFPPAFATALGYTNTSFSDDFTSISTVDLSDTFDNSHIWYRNGWPNNEFGPRNMPDPSLYNIVGGTALELTGIDGEPGSGEAMLNSIGWPRPPVGQPGYFGLANIGIPGRQGFYVEAKILMTVAATAPSGYLFWSMDRGAAENGWVFASTSNGRFPYNYCELDILEAFDVGMGNACTQTIHIWTPTGGNTQTTTTDIPWNTLGLGVYHTFGCLIVPMAQNGGTGYCQFYVDRVPQGAPITWTAGSTYSPVEDTYFFWQFAPQDSTHKITIDYIAVAQLPNPGYSTEAQQFFNRIADPGAGRKALIANIIDNLKSAGIWTKLDALYLLAADQSATALTNLKSSSFGLTVNGNMTFTANVGYQSDGAGTSNLDSGFVPATAGGNFALNSAAMGCYCLTSSTLDTFGNDFMGCNDGSGNRSFINPIEGGQLLGHINSNTAQTMGANANHQGNYTVSRTGASTVTGYKNGAQNGTIGSLPNSTALPNNSIMLFARNGSPTPVGCIDQLSAAWFGAGLSATEAIYLQLKIQEYMMALGINVY